MNKRETVQALMDVVQKGDFATAKSMPAEDFFTVIGADGDVVKATSQLSGTHSGSFDLTNMDMGVIPATNKTFSAKLEKAKLTVMDDKVTQWAVEPADGAGLMAVLEQLEVKPVSA